MAMRFNLSFQEDYAVIDGVSALHLICTTEEPASDKLLYSFDVELYSTNQKYVRRWQGVQMPQGRNSVSIPFVPPLEWANDFTVNVGDITHEEACGLFQATMVVHYTGYAGTMVFTHDYSGYAAQMPGGVKADLLPTVGPIGVQAADGVVPADWGIWVQGKSVARLTVNQAAGTYGSTIVSWRFGSGQEQTQNQADLPLNQSGRVTIPVTVTDSRLRIATADIFLDVKPYQPPSLSQISSFRCDQYGNLTEEGTNFLPKFQLQCSRLDGYNVPYVICRWKKVTDASYGYPQEPISGEAMWADLEAGVSYDVKYTVSDEFNSIDYFDYISSTVYLLHFLKGGTGIAVGKAAEVGNLFDVGLNSKFRRDVTVGGDLNVQGGLQLGGTDVGQSLQVLGNPLTAPIAYQSCLTEVTENTAVKWGRVVVTHLSGVMTNNNQMTHAGYEYHVANLPQGYYSSQYPLMVTASQNGMPCTGYVTSYGAVYLIPNQDGLQDTEISTVGIV